MAREMYLAGVDPAELQPSPPAPPPKTPGEKFAHFWDYHKWQVVIPICVAALLAFFVFQLFGREKFDYTVCLVTQAQMSDAACQALAAQLAQYGTDLNGDGKVTVQVENLFIGTANGQMAAGNSVKLESRFTGTDVMFFIFDPASWDNRIASLLTDADEPLFGVPDSADLYWNWSSSTWPAAFPTLPADLYFTLRLPAGAADNNQGQAVWAQVKPLLAGFMADGMSGATGGTNEATGAGTDGTSDAIATGGTSETSGGTSTITGG